MSDIPVTINYIKFAQVIHYAKFAVNHREMDKAKWALDRMLNLLHSKMDQHTLEGLNIKYEPTPDI